MIASTDECDAQIKFSFSHIAKSATAEALNSFQMRKTDVFSGLESLKPPSKSYVKCAAILDSKEESKKCIIVIEGTKGADDDDAATRVQHMVSAPWLDSILSKEMRDKLNQISAQPALRLLQQLKTRLSVSGHRIRNPRAYVQAAIIRAHKESSGRFTKYSLAETDDLNAAGNSQAAFSFLRELRARKKGQADDADPPPLDSRVQFGRRLSHKRAPKPASSEVAATRQAVRLNHLAVTDPVLLDDPMVPGDDGASERDREFQPTPGEAILAKHLQQHVFKKAGSRGKQRRKRKGWRAPAKS